jgi:hypothetical protein
METRVVYTLAILGALGVGAYFALRPKGSLPPESLIPPQDKSSDQTPPIQNAGLATLAPTESGRNGNGSTKVNGMTGAVYPVVPDPEGRNRECLGVGAYSVGNPVTVDGAAVAEGSDNSVYIDAEGDIYSKGVKIGSWNRSALPSNEQFGHTKPEDKIVVCAN